MTESGCVELIRKTKQEAVTWTARRQYNKLIRCLSPNNMPKGNRLREQLVRYGVEVRDWVQGLFLLGAGETVSGALAKYPGR